jgi:integrase
MPAPMVSTGETGIFKRGSRYVVTWRAGGRQRKKSARTLPEARKLRAAMVADVARGLFDEQTKLTFRAYGEEWLPRYHGNGRGLREHTRTDYARLLQRFAYPWFDGQVPYRTAPKRGVTVSEIRPRDVANLVGWLADEEAQAEHERRLAGEEVREAERRWKRASEEAKRAPGDEQREQQASHAAGQLGSARRRLRQARELDGKRLSDKTVRNVLVPVRSCLSTAVEEGLIRANPTSRVKLPHRPTVEEIEDEHEEVRALAREELGMLLGLLPARWRLLFRFLAVTGLRISELIALEWRHLVLDGERPHVRVRRAIVRGKLGQVKSRHGKRDVPLPFELVSELRRHRQASEWPDGPVFPSTTGTALEPGNLRRRVLAPVTEEAGVPWCGLHTFRHTCASLLFARGRNAVQVQHWLGHHSPAFTLSTYVHLLDEDIGEPLDLAAELKGGFKVAPQPHETSRNTDPAPGPNSALDTGFARPAEIDRPMVTGS